MDRLNNLKNAFSDKKWENYSSTEKIVRLTAGPKLIQIKYVFEYDDYLELYVDIVSTDTIQMGELTHYFSNLAKRDAKEKGVNDYDVWSYAGRIRLYFQDLTSSDKDEKMKNLFKARITAIEESNIEADGSNYSLEANDFDAQTLVGLYAIGVWREEEYLRKDGTVGTSMKLMTFRSIEAYENNEITIPAKKVLEKKPKPAPKPDGKLYGEVKKKIVNEEFNFDFGDDDTPLPSDNPDGLEISDDDLPF